MDFQPLAVTHAGLVSSLGLDMANACAAARAGLSRAQELEFKVLDRETNALENVVGHPLPFATLGYEGTGRLLRIFQLAITSLLESSELESLDTRRTACVIVLPPIDRGQQLPLDAEGNAIEYDNPYLDGNLYS